MMGEGGKDFWQEWRGKKNAKSTNVTDRLMDQKVACRHACKKNFFSIIHFDDDNFWQRMTFGWGSRLFVECGKLVKLVIH